MGYQYMNDDNVWKKFKRFIGLNERPKTDQLELTLLDNHDEEMIEEL